MSETSAAPPLVVGGLHRATLIGMESEYAGRVHVEDGAPGTFDCDLLHASGPVPSLTPGDVVLVWRPESEARGVILGRLGPSPADEATPTAVLPDELVVEARKSLTLRVGDGSITIREDGRILIKGRDLVSHAKRLNRIRGGSVAIN